jgi:hypothetical protein
LIGENLKSVESLLISVFLLPEINASNSQSPILYNTATNLSGNIAATNISRNITATNLSRNITASTVLATLLKLYLDLDFLIKFKDYLR